MIVVLWRIVIEFDVEAYLFECVGNDEGSDLFVVTDCDGLIDKTDMDVCGGYTEFIVQRRLDGEDTAGTVQVIDDKVRDFVHDSILAAMVRTLLRRPLCL